VKKVLVAGSLVVAGIAGWVYFGDGRLPISSESVSADEARVVRIEEAFTEAQAQFRSAARAAAVSGLDTTTEAEAARLEVERLRRELGSLASDLVSDGAKDRARRLDAEMRSFLGT